MSDEHGTTRRGFLTTTAVGGAALAFGCNTLPSDFAVIEGPRQLPPPFIGTGRPDDAQVERERGWTPGPVIRAWRDPGRGLAIRLERFGRGQFRRCCRFQLVQREQIVIGMDGGRRASCNCQ